MLVKQQKNLPLSKKYANKQFIHAINMIEESRKEKNNVIYVAPNNGRNYLSYFLMIQIMYALKYL